MSRRRSGTIRVLAVLGLLTFGLSVMITLQEVSDPVADEANLEPAGSTEAQMGADHPDEAVHVVGALAVFLVGGSGLVGLAIQPRRLGSARQTVAAMLGSIVVMGIVGDPNNHGGQAAPFDVALLIFAVPALAAALSARPWQLPQRPKVQHPRFLAMAVLGLPFLWYGTDQALVQRYTWPPLADPHHQFHWYTMAVLGFVIVFCTAAVALGGRGSRVAAVSAGLGALALGLVGLLSPDAASAPAWPWALGASGWGLGVLALSTAAGGPQAGNASGQRPRRDEHSPAS